MKKFIITNTAITYFSPVKGLMSVNADAVNRNRIISVLMEDNATDQDVIDIFGEVAASLEEYSNGLLQHDEKGNLCIGEAVIPDALEAKIRYLQGVGLPFEHIQKFWERCQENPQKESAEMLFKFLENNDLIIQEDGHFLAYKGVGTDFYDLHSHTFLNKPGCVMTMPRDQVAFDPNEACSCGLHVGSHDYAKNYGQILMLVKVDPADVVSVPYDCDAQKVRVCRYEVIKQIEFDGEDAEDTVDATTIRNERKTTVLNKQNKVVKSVTATSREGRPWTDTEDKILFSLMDGVVEVRWQPIAAKLNRSAEACRRRWSKIKNQLEEQIEAKDCLGKWTEEADELLTDLVKLGKSWAQIAKSFLDVSADACRNRFSRLSK